VLLLPDLVPQAPAEIAVRSVVVRGEPRYRVGFRSASDNLGAGPLIVRGRRDASRPDTMRAIQVIVDSDGTRSTRRLPARIHYVHSSDHSHWHFDAFMRYELRTPDGAARVGRDHKTGFCLGDRYTTSPARPLAGVRGPAVFVSSCGKGRPRLKRLREGISVGYGDDYGPHLEGQEIDITRVAAGRYRLVHTVNPDRSLRESSYHNNSSSTLIRIVRSARGVPAVKVLSRRAPG
jgi:hypothetical protein